jgi:hypothetical protein
LAERLGSPKKVFGSLPGLGREYGGGSPSRSRQIQNTRYKVKRGSPPDFEEYGGRKGKGIPIKFKV